MNFKKYLLDKLPQLVTYTIGYIVIIFMLNAFKVENDLKVAITIVLSIIVLFNIVFDYLRKYKFYKNLLDILET